MGVFDRVEKGLERTVNRVFARAFRSEVQPVEIAGAIRNAMDDRSSSLGPGRTMVPNRYTIELSTTDFGRLDEYSDSITEDLIAAAAEHAETQRYLPGGPIEVFLVEGSDLDTGVFRVRPETSKRSPSSGMPPAPASAAAAPPGAAYSDVPAPSLAPASPSPAAGQPGGQPPSAPRSFADPTGFDAAHAPADPYGRPDVLADPEVNAPPDRALAPGQSAPPAQPAQPAQPAELPQQAPLPPPPAVPAPMPGPGGVPAGPFPAEPDLGGLAQAPGTQRPNPPAKVPRINPASRPWLDIDGERYPLLGSLTIIGRDATADIILDDPGISRRHSEIRITHDGPHLVSSIRDLASTNGTFVNGQRIAIASVRLADGDGISIGRTTIVFRAGKR